MIEKLERILEEYSGKHIFISENTDLRKDLGMNSLELIELVVKLEEAFDIEISDREIMKMATIGDVIEIIQSK